MTGYAHPGGSVIEYASGLPDATEWFEEFHARSRKARAVLAAWPRSLKRQVNERTSTRRSSVRHALGAFRTRLVQAGMFEPCWTHAMCLMIDL